MVAARTLGMQAWDQKPSDASMTVVLACLCGTTAAACDMPCPDGTVPLKFVTATASGTYGGNLYHRKPTITERVRLR